MTIIAVTRLRLRDVSFQDDFFNAALASLEQAKTADGATGSDAFADAGNVWWTVTAWCDRAAMASFVGSEPHASILGHLDEWCDEASFVDWEQDGADLPDWHTSYERLVADGTSSPLTHGTAANAARAFPAPVDAN